MKDAYHPPPDNVSIKLDRQSVFGFPPLSRGRASGQWTIRRGDCLSPAGSRASFGASDRMNRTMQQASCCQARRQAERDAQQSPDCEHPSKLCNTAWRHGAPLHRTVRNDAQAYPKGSWHRAPFFWFVFFGAEENEHKNSLCLERKPRRRRASGW